MRISKSAVFALFLCCLLVGAQSAVASLPETTVQVGKSAVDTAMDVVMLPVDLVKTIGYSLKLVGEVIVFPFTLL